MSKPIDYRFRACIDLESLDEVLVNYLKNKATGLSEREKVLGAARAYWLPFAMQEQGNYCEHQLKYYARVAIYRLKLHINYLAENFGLPESEYLGNAAPGQTNCEQIELSQLMPSSQTIEEKVNQTAPRLVIEDKQKQQDISEQVDKIPQDFIHHPDDDTFHQIFS